MQNLMWFIQGFEHMIFKFKKNIIIFFSYPFVKKINLRKNISHIMNISISHWMKIVTFFKTIKKFGFIMGILHPIFVLA